MDCSNFTLGQLRVERVISHGGLLSFHKTRQFTGAPKTLSTCNAIVGNVNRNRQMSGILIVHEDHCSTHFRDLWVRKSLTGNESEGDCRCLLGVAAGVCRQIEVGNEVSADSSDLVLGELNNQFPTFNRNALVGLLHPDLQHTRFAGIQCLQREAVIGTTAEEHSSGVRAAGW